MNNKEVVVLVAIVFLVLFVILPNVFSTGCNCGCADCVVCNGENFTSVQEFSGYENVSGTDPTSNDNKMVHPRGSKSDYESLIYDNTTGAIMSGSQFMEKNYTFTINYNRY